jgi:hypothetical protein
MQIQFMMTPSTTTRKRNRAFLTKPLFTIVTLSNINNNINQWQVICPMVLEHCKIAKVAYPTGTSRASIANFACHMKQKEFIQFYSKTTVREHTGT